MGPNFMIIPAVAIIPMIVGFIWYNPKVMGTAWMAETGMTEEKAQQGNMMVIFGLSYLFSLMLALALNGMVNHQMGIFSLFAAESGFGEPGSPATVAYESAMATVGDKHLTWSHGLLHGIIGGLFFVLPLFATNALFEQKSWKYIWINVGYWIVCLAAMGAVLGQYGFKV